MAERGLIPGYHCPDPLDSYDIRECCDNARLFVQYTDLVDFPLTLIDGMLYRTEHPSSEEVSWSSMIFCENCGAENLENQFGDPKRPKE